ncbi:hypothetical protein E2C01_031996 [Portunus trituberculatus]|uniref:Uncharacterized protein n=1 Tax=Portunus trituberculatus TaxID=210409 RepID=A0A5B7EZP8_PORTR|nr:hypothetical protein [Portunus trituberculatus]
MSVRSTGVSSIRPGAHLTLQSVSNREDQIPSLSALMWSYHRDTFSRYYIAAHQAPGCAPRSPKGNAFLADRRQRARPPAGKVQACFSEKLFLHYGDSRDALV